MHKQVKLEYLRFNWDLLSVFCINLFNSYRIKEKLNYQPVISSRLLSDNFTYSSLNHSKVFKEAEYPKSFVASNSTLTVNQIGGDRKLVLPVLCDVPNRRNPLLLQSCHRNTLERLLRKTFDFRYFVFNSKNSQ